MLIGATERHGWVSSRTDECSEGCSEAAAYNHGALTHGGNGAGALSLSDY